MIKSAGDKRTARFLEGEAIPAFQAIQRQAQRRIAILNEASCIEDLMRLPSNPWTVSDEPRASIGRPLKSS